MYRKQSVLHTSMIVAVILLLLVGCSSNNKSSESSTAPSSTPSPAASAETSSAPADATQYPIVIKHALGETVIEKKPERIATIAWANHDVVLALGIVPVGFSAANYGVTEEDNGLLPWTAQKLKELGADNPNLYQDTDGLDFEAIADSNPDVILAAYSGITPEEYQLLSQIAPTVAYPTTPWVISWQDQIRYNAMGMGMEKEGEQLIKDTEQLIKDKAAAAPELKDKKVVFVSMSESDLSIYYVYTPGDPRGEFLLELGMQYPDSILNAIEDPNTFYLTMSAENADLLNEADVIVSYGDDSMLQALQAHPTYGKVPAIARGSVVFVGNNTPLAASLNPNPLSIAYTIDQYIELIRGAISKING